VGLPRAPQSRYIFATSGDRRRTAMLKSVVLPGAAVTLAAAALLLPLRGPEAAAQPAQAFVNVVDLEITPASMPRFLAALKDDGAAAIKEAGTQEFVSSVGQKDKNHVFIFEVFNDAAAWDAHQKTVTYAKFLGLTMMMIKTYTIRPFTSVTLNKSSAPAPQADPPLVLDLDEIDVVDGQVDKFEDAANTHGAASVQDPGCREFDVVVSQTKKNHVLLLSAFDNAAALAANQASDHYKAYQVATKGMISAGTETPLSSVAVLTKGQ
jgi:(4S)-4-hydroxy-5-phosphonooxypentane-2,3-dione isomerase